MREAFRQLGQGRVRPVAIEMEMDVMALEAHVPLLEPLEAEAPLEPDAERIAEAAALLGQARKSAIFVGGGVFGAEEELTALAAMLEAPVVMSGYGQGAISDRHYLAQRYQAGHRLWAEADVVLAVATRLQPPLSAWGTDEGLKIIRLDIDPVEITRVSRPAIGIVADARAGLRALIASLGGQGLRAASRKDEMDRLRSEAQREYEKLSPQIHYVRALRAALPDDGIFVDELTQVGYLARFAFPAYRPRGYITTGYQGTLGFGFATALGVKVANLDRPVLSISGDGGFLYNAQELATAVQQRIGVVAVVFRDDAFGNVQREQVEAYGGKVIATDLHNPDFVSLAESFGAVGRRATTSEELGEAVRRGFDEDGPVVIAAPIGVVPSPWHLMRMPRVRSVSV